MKPETTITYDGKPCRVLTTEKFLNDPLILIENQLGREPWLQKFITQDEYQRALAGRPQPKLSPTKETRLMYGNRAESNWTTLKACMALREVLCRKTEYKRAEFVFEQR